jgi:transcriptional regulator NrdR family protein
MGWRESTVRLVKDILRQKTIRELIAKELKEAHMRKLEAESAVEYARSIVIYNEQRIKRLQERLTEHTEEGDYA